MRGQTLSKSKVVEERSAKLKRMAFYIFMEIDYNTKFVLTIFYRFQHHYEYMCQSTL